MDKQSCEASVEDFHKRIAKKIAETQEYAINNPSERDYAEGQANGLRIAGDYLSMCFNLSTVKESKPNE